MKFLNGFLFVAAISIWAAGASGAAAPEGDAAAYEVRLISSTLKVFPDETPPGAVLEPMTLLSIRNEFSPFQVAVTGLRDAADITVSVTDFTGPEGAVIPASDIPLYIVENVTIEKPSMTSERKVWPDPLPPNRSFELGAGETRAVWVDLFTPAEASPGVYKGSVTVSSPEDGDVAIGVKLDVRGIDIPTAPTIKTAFGLGYRNIKTAHQLSDDSPELQPLYEDYYWFHIEHRISPYAIPVDFYSEEAHKFLDDPRVTYYKPPFSWDEAEMRRIDERLRETGWIDKAVFYVVDEPLSDEYARVNKIAEWIHSIDPDLKMLITHPYHPDMDEVDVWCPGLTFTAFYDDVRKIYQEVEEKGKEFWWYTCIMPKWEGTTYFIDDWATAPRTHPWMNYVYDVSGILYWRTTCWDYVDHNPWAATETYPSVNGDGHLIYPGYQVGYNGPVASIRLKMLREGLEDYELLHILGDTLEETAKKIAGDDVDYDPQKRLYEHAFALITDEGRSYRTGKRTPYLMFVSTDYKQLETQREKVISEIEQTPQGPLMLVSTDPSEHSYTNKGVIQVDGLVETGCQVEVNGLAAMVDGNRFSAQVQIAPGENIIAVTASCADASKTVTRTVNKF